MKKTLLFAALAAMTMSAAAQTWDFGTFTTGQITETTEVEGFKIYATAEKVVEVAENKKAVEGITYTKCIKTGGNTQFESGVPVARAYEFAVSGPGKIEYVMTSSSKDDPNRYIKFVVAGDTVYKENAPAGSAGKYSFDYTGVAGQMQIVFTNGAINMYMVSYTAGGDTPDTPDTPVEPSDDWYFNAANIEVPEGEKVTFEEDYVSGIYSFMCNGKTWEVDANNVRFDVDSTVVYTQRIKAKSKSNSIIIAAPDKGTLTFGVRTGSNSATDRTLVVTQNGTELYNKVVVEADTMITDGTTPKTYLAPKVVVPAAGEVVVTMPNGNLNYYFITFDNGTGDVKELTFDNKLFMANNVVVADGAARVYVYNVLGRLVATANANEIDLAKQARGIYIVKAVYENGKTATLKVRR